MSSVGIESTKRLYRSCCPMRARSAAASTRRFANADGSSESKHTSIRGTALSSPPELITTYVSAAASPPTTLPATHSGLDPSEG